MTTLRYHDDDLLSPEQRAAIMGPGAPFEIVEDDVQGARVQVFAQRPPNLRAMLPEAAEKFGDRSFLVFSDHTITFAEFPARVAAVADVLARDYKLEHGDRLAIAAANCLEYVLVEWAALSLGVIVAGLNGWWTAEELAYGVELTQPAVLMGDDPRLTRIAEAGIDVGVPVVRLEDVLARAGESAVAALPTVEIDEDDPALILFTSGTTGRPKGATLSHRNIIHFGLANAFGRAVSAALAARPSATGGAPASVCGSPFFHISGTAAILMSGPRFGSTIVFPPPGRWDPGTHLALTERHRVTSWSGVPTHYWRMLEHPDFETTDLSSLLSVGSGGTPFPPELIRLIREKVHDVDVSNGYGATETTGVGTVIGGALSRARPDSVGPAVPTMQLQVRDADGSPDGRVLDEGEIGEVCIRGACVFLGYWGDPEATEKSLYADRWYRTGDFGRIDDGVLYIDSRREDLILRGGENIYPIEIEHRIVEHPDVVDAAVIGVPDRELGQVVKAYVVTREGVTLPEHEVQEWVGKSLAGFKVPASVEFRTTLPYTETGKVMKHAL
ncbi:MAG: class I adenylate-forming enzyme family protein [Acidimicrobiia bacterium]